MLRAFRVTLRCAVLLAVLAAARAAPAGAQAFFAESDALRPGTALELSLSDLTQSLDTNSGGITSFDNVDSSARAADGRLRQGFLALGALGERRRFHEVTDTFEQRDDREQSAGYLAVVLEGLLTKDSDALYIVASSSTRHETFTYDGYQRQLDAVVSLQGGLVYRLGFLIAGYVRGRENLQLRVADPTLPYALERYPFGYRAYLGGIQLGNPDRLGLLLVVQRKDTPRVAGTTIDLQEGYEELQRAALGLGVLRIDVSRTRVREAFSGESLRQTTEQEASLGLQVTEHVLLALSQRRINDLQGFTLLGIPATSATARKENLLRFALRF